MATSYAVFAAGDAHNLEMVAPILREKYIDAVIIVAGDDDWLARYNKGVKSNTGAIAAEKAAKAIDGALALPWFNPEEARPPKATDFNDEHKQYGLDEVRVTIKYALDAYETARKRERDNEPPPSTHEDYGLPADAVSGLQFSDTNKYGIPSATCTNARIAIEALGISCSYDIFHDRMLVGGHVIEQWAGELSDHGCEMLRVVIKERFGFEPGRENTHDAAVRLCLQNQFDPVLDYLNSVKWDKKPRLGTWLQIYLGAEQTKLNGMIGRLILVASVRRARQPGCKFDQIAVLEGPEGKGKPSAIEALAGKENFSDQTILGLRDKEQQEAAAGVWLYEIADLAGMSRADVDKTKAFASRQADRARPAYGRKRVDQPRRCIFIATTNNDTYLKSQTGNQRFWPVKTGHVDLKALRRDRDQLWAEAAQVEATGASLTLPETLWGEAATEQDRRMEVDPWDEMLSNAIGTICDSADGLRREGRISNTELLKGVLTLTTDKCTDTVVKPLGHCMVRLGWEKPADPIRIPGKGKVRGFRRPYPPPTIDE
jgi:predicted P-loop ATPase